jgi:hypothetical protein
LQQFKPQKGDSFRGFFGFLIAREQESHFFAARESLKPPTISNNKSYQFIWSFLANFNV